MIERPQYYNLALNQFGSANPSQTNIEKKLDSDAPFRLLGIAIISYLGNSLSFTNMRMTRPDRSWIQRFLAPMTALNPFYQDVQGAIGEEPGGAPPPFLFASPISPNLIYPPGGTIVFDFSNLADTIAQLVLVGTKIFRPGAVWAPSYPPKPYRSIPFLDYALQITPPAFGAAPLLQVPFDVQPDADFAWQAGQHTGGGMQASLTLGGEALASIEFAAVTPGTGGDAITVAITSPGPLAPLLITVVANAITIQPQTDGGGAILTTGAQLAIAMNSTPAAAALVTTICQGSCGDPIPNTGGVATPLTGGTNVGPTGGIGIRIRDWNGKYYMDDFTPIELIFGFAHAQTPGLLYPEIYIPKNQALYFDFSTLSNIPAAVAELTLSLKGQKVYGGQS
jgi:hypothetical protein